MDLRSDSFRLAQRNSFLLVTLDVSSLAAQAGSLRLAEFGPNMAPNAAGTWSSVERAGAILVHDT